MFIFLGDLFVNSEVYKKITKSAKPLFYFPRLSVSGNVVDTVCWSQVPRLPSLTFLGLYGNQVCSHR